MAEENGKVYVFNCYSEEIKRLAVEEMDLGKTIARWQQEPAEKKYTPSGLPVARTKTPESGKFGVGTVQLRAEWTSYSGKTTITIPDPKHSSVRLVDDLIIYLTQKVAILMTIGGEVLSTTSVELLSLAEAEEEAA